MIVVSIEYASLQETLDRLTSPRDLLHGRSFFRSRLEAVSGLPRRGHFSVRPGRGMRRAIGGVAWVRAKSSEQRVRRRSVLFKRDGEWDIDGGVGGAKCRASSERGTPYNRASSIASQLQQTILKFDLGGRSSSLTLW